MGDVLRQVIEADPAPPRRWNLERAGGPGNDQPQMPGEASGSEHPFGAGVGGELERFLNFEPILARPAGSLRTNGSWSQNPWVLAAGCGLLVLCSGCVAYGILGEIARPGRAIAHRGRNPSRRLAHGRGGARSSCDHRAGEDAPLPQMQSPWRTSRLTAVTPTARTRSNLRANRPRPVLEAVSGVCFLSISQAKDFSSESRRRAERRASSTAPHLLLTVARAPSAPPIGRGVLALLQIRFWVRLTSLQTDFPLELVRVMCALVLL